ncbi:MAG: HlyD family efflux transporter periplasmic adaptor subunit [Hespellia sp.]|nr:HlyD family efflux transporter periplasmic adaptor subunit [Hespellia sp.]
MASKKNNSINITRYKNKQELNIGIFVFAIIFIYLVITILAYVTSKHVSVYEVREGSILKDTSYTGIILRDETTVNVDADGYINYFMSENSKVKAGTNIFTISADSLPQESISTESPDATLSSAELDSLVLKTQNFNLAFDDQDFSQVQTFKSDIDTTLQKAANQTKTAQLDALLNSDAGAGLTVFQTPADGVFSLNVDGYEDLSLDTMNLKDLDKTNYSEKKLQNNRKVKNGDSAYKLVTTNNWSVVVELSDADAEKLKDTTYVKTRIENSTETIGANFTLIDNHGSYWGVLSYTRSMIQYIDKRYVNVELILEDESGLKIPKTSVLKKSFYVVPASYITQGGDSSASGVLVQRAKSKKNVTEFVAADIYQKTEDMVYLNPDIFNDGDVLVNPDGGDTLSLSQKDTLTGVYNMNKGYTLFQQVAILCESDDYYIVQSGAAYSLSNYDHIVLDSTSVKEGEVIFQ